MGLALLGEDSKKARRKLGFQPKKTDFYMEKS